MGKTKRARQIAAKEALGRILSGGRVEVAEWGQNALTGRMGAREIGQERRQRQRWESPKRLGKQIVKVIQIEMLFCLTSSM